MGSGKGVLIFVSASAAVVIFAVHYQQTWEQTQMKKGVLRDIERQKQREALRAKEAATSKMKG